METPLHVFDFSFRSKRESNSDYPALVFTLPHGDLENMYALLHTFAERVSTHATTYLETQEIFHIPPDLFGNMYLGYRRVGHIETDEMETHIVFPLGPPAHTRPLALTIHITLAALNFLVYSCNAKSNRRQLVRLDTSAVDRTAGYGHGVWGDIYPDMVLWLRAYAERTKDVPTIWGTKSVPLPRGVESAMRETWQCLSAKSSKTLSKFVGGNITKDGRFSLHCAGNACDLSVYPDGYREEAACEYGALLGCHNLDGACQQLTLLAGLAKLTSIAQREMA